MEEQVHLLEPAQFVKMDVAPAVYCNSLETAW